MKDVIGSVVKQSSQQQCGVLRSSENKALSQDSTLLRRDRDCCRCGCRPSPRRFQERGLRSGCDRMVRSPRLGSMILLLSPLAQGTKFIVVPKRCDFPWQGASYRRRSTQGPTKRPRLTMTRSILRRSFTIALVCLGNRKPN
jgi:hypothetical protein